MKIVILDGYTLNPGDLSWEPLSKFGTYKVYERTPPELTLERSFEADVLLTNKTVLSKELLDQLPNLKYIGVLATGYNVVDIEAARQRGIPVSNVPEYGTNAVNQMVFAHILRYCHNVEGHNASVKKGEWESNQDFCYWLTPQRDLSCLTLGLIGLGKIGAAVARTARTFGMKVVAHTSSGVNRSGIEEVEMMPLDSVLQQADIISLHCPLTPSTEGLINKSRLSLMKPSAFLINTGRGPLINESDLAEALQKGIIAGAGVDVLTQEPPIKGSPLLLTSECYITPHIAWATHTARQRLMTVALSNLEYFLAKQPKNIIN